MRHVQRGISMTFLVVAILVIAIASAYGYFAFSQDLKKKVTSINSFEDCAKFYPIMESYPEQCSTPDGKHFTRQLTDEEKYRLAPSAQQSSDTNKSTGELNNIYVNDQGQFSINYPTEWIRNSGGIYRGEDNIYIGTTMKSLESAKKSYNRGDATLSNTATFSTKNIAGKEITLADVTFMQHDGYGNYSEPERSYIALIPLFPNQTLMISGDLKLKPVIDQMIETLKPLK